MSKPRQVHTMNWAETEFHSNKGRGGAILEDLEFHLSRGEIAAAWEFDRELRGAAKSYNVKRYKGVPCSHEGHGRLRHTVDGTCCVCVKEGNAARLVKTRREREERRLAAEERAARLR